MNQRRLYYRVLLKSFTALAVLVLLAVLLNSLFIKKQQSNVKTNKDEKASLISVDLSSMKQGDILKTRWKGKEVAVLLREANIASLQKNKPATPSLSSSPLRSISPYYFVYINHGDSGNCPLFYSQNTFKDVCTSTLFDTTGRDKKNRLHGYQLELPPHSISDNKLLIGAWDNKLKETID